MIWSRTFAVIAAALLVGAVALVMLAPPGLPLGEALFRLDHRLPLALRGTSPVSGLVWRAVLRPLLVRPAWLLPASLGMVAAGVSLTLGTSGTGRGKRRRPGSPGRWL
ncbi:MAG: hypothetical protein ACP5NP_16420 [Acetobacteraceae bacterium]